MVKSASDAINTLRNVTGRVDDSDPLFTNTVMLTYLNDFITQQASSDVRLFKNETWYEFNIDTTTADPLPVDLQALSLSTIGPPAYVQYITDPTNGSFELFWYQDPKQFFALWPEIGSANYAPQRPTYVLYYNNELIFRGPPDQQYHIKIKAYQEELEINPEGNIPVDYLFRYIVYGAAINLFNDAGEWDYADKIFPAFRRYRALVYSRTFSQYQNQRSNPEF